MRSNTLQPEGAPADLTPLTDATLHIIHCSTVLSDPPRPAPDLHRTAPDVLAETPDNARHKPSACRDEPRSSAKP